MILISHMDSTLDPYVAALLSIIIVMTWCMLLDVVPDSHIYIIPSVFDHLTQQWAAPNDGVGWHLLFFLQNTQSIERHVCLELFVAFFV